MPIKRKARSVTISQLMLSSDYLLCSRPVIQCSSKYGAFSILSARGRSKLLFYRMSILTTASFPSIQFPTALVPGTISTSLIT